MGTGRVFTVSHLPGIQFSVLDSQFSILNSASPRFTRYDQNGGPYDRSLTVFRYIANFAERGEGVMT